MSLSDLIHNRAPSGIANAKAANLAKGGGETDSTLATLATLALATPKNEKNSADEAPCSPREKPDEGAAAVWRVVLPGREILAHNVPPATRAHMMRLYPNALSVEVEYDFCG
jgi:hypothetical protein